MNQRLVYTLFVLVGLAFGVDEASATPAGTVIAVSGLCTNHGRVLRRGDSIEVSDTVQVPQDGHLQLTMADGSVISFAPSSIMVVASYEVDGAGRFVKLSLRQGLLRARVTPLKGPSTFEISTATGTASVPSDGGDWFIRAQADSAEVGVLAGIVDLTSNATKQLVSIPSHWGTRNEAGLDPVLPRRWARREFNSVINLTNVGVRAGRIPVGR
jgi:hypothetical protein